MKRYLFFLSFAWAAAVSAQQSYSPRPAAGPTVASTTSPLAGDGNGNAVAETTPQAAALLSGGTGTLTLSGYTLGLTASQIPAIPESGVTNLTTDLAAKASAPVVQTYSGTGGTVTINAGTTVLLLQTALTTPLVATLPVASGGANGTSISTIDPGGYSSVTNTVSVARAGSDTINGGTANVPVLYGQQARTIWRDGASKWSTSSPVAERAYSASAGLADNNTFTGSNTFVVSGTTPALMTMATSAMPVYASFGANGTANVLQIDRTDGASTTLRNGYNTPFVFAIGAGTASAATARLVLYASGGLSLSLSPSDPGLGTFKSTNLIASGSITEYGTSASVPGVLSTTSVNAAAAANTALYTVPTGKTCVVTGYVVRVTAASGITTGPSAGVGNAAGTNNIAASQSMGGLTSTATTGSTSEFSWPIVGMSSVTPAGGTIYFNLGTAAAGTSETLSVDTIGYIY